jgi:cytidine deaminase
LDQFPLSLGLDAADLALVDAARAVLIKHYRPFWHTVGAALRSRDGRIWTGVHLGATVECAVAVRHPKPEETIREIAIVPPCGACREMLTDFDPAADIIVPTPDGPRRLAVRALLPFPYQR